MDPARRDPGGAGRRWCSPAGRCPAVADYLWIASTVAAIVPAAWWVISGLRNGKFGWTSSPSSPGGCSGGAGVSGRRADRRHAGHRAGVGRRGRTPRHKGSSALLDRVPRTARRRVGDEVEVVELDAIAPDDVVLVGPGEVLPVDGRVHSDYAVIDDSALTGEPLQVRYDHDEAVRSGSVNAGSAMELRASATARTVPMPASSDWLGRPLRSPHRWSALLTGWPRGSFRWHWCWPVEPGC